MDEASKLRPCCGSQPRGRHKKGCRKAGSTPNPKNRRTVDNRHPFSEPTYNVVKTLLEKAGATSDMVSAEKGLELEEVRRTNLSDDYEDYLTIA